MRPADPSEICQLRLRHSPFFPQLTEPTSDSNGERDCHEQSFPLSSAYMFGISNTGIPEPRSQRPSRAKGRQLCQVDDGRWMTLRSDRYFIGEQRLATEDALILLIDLCRRYSGLEWKLRSILPESDWKLILGNQLLDVASGSIPDHEHYLIELLRAKDPPTGWLSLHYEQVHRAALSSDLTDQILKTKLPLALGFIWHPCFGEAVRQHRPMPSPFSRWRVITELAYCTARMVTAEQRDLRQDIIWAHSEWRIHAEAAHDYRAVLSIERLTSDASTG